MSYVCGIIDIGSGEFSFERLFGMSRAMTLRGARAGAYVNKGVGICHGSNAASLREPYTIVRGGRAYTAVLDGEIYNRRALAELIGIRKFECDAEAALECYIAFGYECAALLEGVFSLAVYDETLSEVYLARDSLGARPLYYLRDGGRVSFASEIKGLFRYMRGGIEAERAALCELILSPTADIGGGELYREVNELPAGHFAVCSALGMQIRRYKGGDACKIFGRWICEGEAIVPSERAIGEGEVLPLMSELLAAFDYPRFDEYAPSYLSTIAKSSGGSVLIKDGTIRSSPAYAFERADRLGTMRGVSVRIVPADDLRDMKRKTLLGDEKKLAAAAESLFSSELSFIRNELGSDTLERISAERDTKARVRAFGRLIQSELWLRRYPVLLV